MPPANVALLNRAPTDRAVERSECVLLRQSEALDVAKPAVIGLGDDWQMEGLRSATAHGNGRDRIADDADLIGVGNANRRAEKALLCEPRKAGHLSVAVE